MKIKELEQRLATLAEPKDGEALESLAQMAMDEYNKRILTEDCLESWGAAINVVIAHVRAQCEARHAAELAAANERAAEAERGLYRLNQQVVEAAREKHGGSGMCCSLREQDNMARRQAEADRDRLAAELSALRKRHEGLVAACEPFKTYYDVVLRDREWGSWPDEHRFSGLSGKMVTIGDMRKLQAALSPQPEQPAPAGGEPEPDQPAFVCPTCKRSTIGLTDGPTVIHQENCEWLLEKQRMHVWEGSDVDIQAAKSKAAKPDQLLPCGLTQAAVETVEAIYRHAEDMHADAKPDAPGDGEKVQQTAAVEQTAQGVETAEECEPEVWWVVLDANRRSPLDVGRTYEAALASAEEICVTERLTTLVIPVVPKSALAALESKLAENVTPVA